MPFSYKDYPGNGSTTTFSITFDYQKESEISVTVDGVAQSGFTFPSSTQVTLTSAPASGALVRIRRTTDLNAREVDFASGSVLTEEDLDNSNIQVFHAAQEAIDTSNDAISLDDDDKWDAQSKVIKNVANPTNAQDAATKDYLENTWLTASDKAQLNLLDLDNLDDVADDIANVNTVATNIADVNTVAARDADIDTVADRDSDIGIVALRDADIGTVADRDSDIGIVADRDSDIGTVADNDADISTVATDLNLASPKITTVATNITNVNNVGGDITNVNTVATDIANVNTVAGELGAGQDVTIVATNISDVTTVAHLQDGTTATDAISDLAAIVSDITAVAAIEQDIQDVQDEIANLQTVANDLNEATSEIETVAASIANVDIVGTDITNVNTVATNIADVNNFADTYFVGATEPSGTTLGDLWFDTTADVMKVKASGGFVNAGSSVNGTSERQVYTAGTASGDYDGNSLTTFPVTYDAGFVDVYLNGVKMQIGTDVTATSGTDIVFATATTSGDVVDIVAYGTFELSTTELNDLSGVSVPSPSNGNVLKYNGTNWIAASADVVDDTSPQLGADLDGNTFSIDLTSATDSFGLPVGTTAQEPTATAGHIRYDSDKGVLTYANGTNWTKVSAEIPSLTSITGNIYAGLGTTLTLAGSKFLTGNLVVNFLQSADSINHDITITPTSDSAASVTVPSAVYSNLTAGNVVTIKVTNSDGGISGNLTKTALALPTGGTVTTVSGFRVHQINSTSNFVIPTGVSLTADYIVVAGGGGGSGWGGGGGAGGIIETTSQAMTAGTYQAVIGGGGNKGTSGYTAGTNGSTSSFNGTSTVGGGTGGHYDSNLASSGGSGGGGSMGSTPSGRVGAAGTAGQGNAGGSGGGQDSLGNWTRAGGGGGKGGVGTNGSVSASDTGDGGVGVDYSTNYGNIGHGGYLGGGAGGHLDSRGGLPRASGGQGGGGIGGSYHDTNGSLQGSGGNGSVNTGGGGGGGYGDGASMDCGTGGSGTVLIRYQLS